VAAMDPLNSEQRRKNMQAIRAAGTKAEVLLSKALWSKGYRYRKNDKTLPGKPDIVFKRYKIAIFCDGEFWHGKDWGIKKPKLDQNKEYWVKKIERNMERDKEVKYALENDGWTVIRFWDKEIRKNLNNCLKVIEELILQKGNDCV
jgi:DNA mismatch endonuclease Vsr